MRTPTPSTQPGWSTSAQATEASRPQDLLALVDHLLKCQVTAGPGLVLRCAAEWLQGFVATRVVTSVLVMLVVLAGSSGLAR